MPRLSLGLGVQTSRSIKPTIGLGLPAQIIVSGAGVANGTYTKTSSSGIYTSAPIPGTFNYLLLTGIFYITSPGNTNLNADYLGNDWVLASGNNAATIYSENTSTNVNNVPTSGWSPAITITSA